MLAEKTSVLAVLLKSKKLEMLMSILEKKFFKGKGLSSSDRSSLEKFLSSLSLKSGEFSDAQVSQFALSACTKKIATLGI